MEARIHELQVDFELRFIFRCSLHVIVSRSNMKDASSSNRLWYNYLQSVHSTMNETSFRENVIKKIGWPKPGRLQVLFIFSRNFYQCFAFKLNCNSTMMKFSQGPLITNTSMFKLIFALFSVDISGIKVRKFGKPFPAILIFSLLFFYMRRFLYEVLFKISIYITFFPNRNRHWLSTIPLRWS